MSTSKIMLELRADDNNNQSVSLYDLQNWIEDVKRHTDADNVDVRLLVGCLQVER